MKQLVFTVIGAAVVFAACQNAPDASKATTAETQTVANAGGASYSLDSAAHLEWVGSKAIGSYHHGTINISNGTFTVADGSLTGGNFVIDLNTLTDLDLKPEEGKEKLEGHLKSPDFLDVAKFPTGKFEITSVAPLTNDTAGTHTISGNLTLKDSTKNVTFPATINVDGNNVSAKANFNIDRTQWGIHYGAEKSLGDKMILPEVNIKFDLRANKQ